MLYLRLRTLLLRQFERLMLWACPRIAALCERHGRLRVIDDHFDPNVPYLHRHYLIFKDRKYWWQACNIFLHRFLRGDGDCAVHDHPFSYVTVILTAGYWEITPAGRFWRGPGSILMRGATSRHRVEIEPTAGPVYTLFWAGPRTREWGFCDEAGRWWLRWDDYLDDNLAPIQESLARKPKKTNRPKGV